MTEQPPQYDAYGRPLYPRAGYALPSGGWQPSAVPADPLVSTDYAGWWSRGTALAKRCWRQLLVLQLLGAVLTVLLQVVPTYLQLRSAVARVADPFAGLAPWGVRLVTIPFTIVVSSLVVLASVYVVVAAATGGNAAVGDALRAAVRRVGPLVGWSFVAGLAVLVGLLACVLPGVYLALVATLLPPVVAFERRGVPARCFRLFHADPGAALARTATMAALGLAAAGVAGVLNGILAVVAISARVGSGGIALLAALGLLAGFVVAIPVALLTTPLTVVTYADLRGRVEPVSTEQLAAELVR